MPLGISGSLWRQRIPKDNPLTAAKVKLGRTLYFDKRLSQDGSVSCATCHDPAIAFTDANVVAKGVGAKTGTRNAPTVLNAMFNQSFFWDGRVASLEEQIKQPLLSPFEMGMVSEGEVVARVSGVPEYRHQFSKVFNAEGITIETISKAIAAYERTLLSGNSRFDRFILGDESAISSAQRRGWELFRGKAQCIHCHTFSPESPFFTDFTFHNTGVAASDGLFAKLIQRVQLTNNSASGKGNPKTLLAHSEGFSELGRFNITLKELDTGAFKTPTLRDIELTSPYMHNGSIKTLMDVVRYYNRGGDPNSQLDKRMRPLHLTESESNDLVEFMRALTSDEILKLCQTSIPQNRNPVKLSK